MNRIFIYFCIASGPRVKLASCKSALNPTVVYRIPLKPALGGVCSLANCSAACEETQSNRVFDFRDCVYSLFPKAILFDFYFTLLTILRRWSRC